jgi:hypothetical protein
MTSAVGEPTSRVALTASDQRPALSRTLKVIVWVPELSDEVLKDAWSLRVPLRFDCQRYPATVSSESVPWPVN